MKSLLIAFTLFASVFTKTTFAQQNPIAPAILNTFNLAYSKATHVKWAKVEKLYKAEFMLDNQSTSIFYDENGEVVATSHYIVPSDLPMTLQKELKKYKDYQLTGLFEVADKEKGSFYYTVVENDKKVVTLQSVDNQVWDTFISKRK